MKALLRTILFCHVVGVTAIAQQAPSVADWRSDLDEVAKEIRVNHPDPFTKTGKLVFLRDLERLKTDLPKLNEEQRMVRAMRWVASIGDGHTQLEPDNARFARWYPVRIYEFADGYFVVSAHRSAIDLLGAQVLEIAGKPVDEVARAARDLIGADNDLGRKERLYALHNAGMMIGLGFAGANGDLPVKIKRRDGKVTELRLAPQAADDPEYKGNESRLEWQDRGEMFGTPVGGPDSWTTAYRQLPASAFSTMDTGRPLHLMARVPFVSHAIPEKSVYYIQANTVGDTDMVASFRKAMQEVDQLKPKYLIVDLRYNFGGDGSRVREMIEEFIKRKEQQPWGNLYVLTGGRTFSAAIMLLHAFVDNLALTIVGEPAGAPMNSYGDAVPRRFTRTGIHLRVSTMWHQLGDPNDLSDVVPVDVPAVFSFADYTAGRDPAIDPILDGQEMRSITAIARADGGLAAQRAWRERSKKYANVSWWQPPHEAEIRQACRALFEQGRTADAIETCRLSTEVDPFEWHSWFNLGYFLRKSGQAQQGLANYQCVNKVDPNNFNADAIKELLVKLKAEDTPPVPECPVK